MLAWLNLSHRDVEDLLAERGRYSLTHDAQGRDSVDSDLYSFFKLMRATSYSEKALNTSEAIEASEVIVRGRIVSLIPGRTLEHKNGYSRPIDMALLKIEVTKVVKGKVGKHIYVETVRGGISTDLMDSRKYEEEMFLLPGKPS